MPKLTQAVPKYRRHKASGQAIVTLCGKDHFLGPHRSKTSINEYDRLIAEFLANGRRLVDPDVQTAITVTEVIAAFWKHAKTYYRKDGKPTSELSNFRLALRPVRRLYGDKPAIEFGPLALKAVRETWIRDGQTRGNINKNVRRIVRVFRWAAAEQLIPASVRADLATLEGLRKGRSNARESEPVLPVDLAVVEATVEHLSPVVRDMVRLQLLTGARPGEVCSLRPCDIDRTGDVWEFRVDGHKTEHHDRDRTVYIGPEAQTLLSSYLQRDPQAFCFSPRDADRQFRAAKRSSRVRPLKYEYRESRQDSRLRDSYDTSSYRRAIHRGCDRAFPPADDLTGNALKAWRSDHRWSPNRLRHTTGTAVRKRFGLEAAQVILGHSVADVTQIYAERDAEKAREVARAIG